MGCYRCNLFLGLIRRLRRRIGRLLCRRRRLHSRCCLGCFRNLRLLRKRRRYSRCCRRSLFLCLVGKRRLRICRLVYKDRRRHIPRRLGCFCSLRRGRMSRRCMGFCRCNLLLCLADMSRRRIDLPLYMRCCRRSRCCLECFRNFRLLRMSRLCSRCYRCSLFLGLGCKRRLRIDLLLYRRRRLHMDRCLGRFRNFHLLRNHHLYMDCYRCSLFLGLIRRRRLCIGLLRCNCFRRHKESRLEQD